MNFAQQDCSHGRDAQARVGTLEKVGGGVAGFDFTRLSADGSHTRVVVTTIAILGAVLEITILA